MSDFKLPVGAHVDLPEEHYHYDRSFSSTALKQLLVSPAHCKAFLERPIEVDTTSIRKGKALHLALLEPHLFKEKVFVKERGQDISRMPKGRVAMTPTEYKHLKMMKDSALQNEEAQAILENATYKELTLVWDDPIGGRCKCRIDIYAEKQRALGDVKTAKDISFEGFSKAIKYELYYVQLAFYKRALSFHDAAVDLPFFLAVENKYPFEVAYHPLGSEYMALGEAIVEAGLKVYRQCQDDDYWPGLSKTFKTIHPDKWARKHAETLLKQLGELNEYYEPEDDGEGYSGDFADEELDFGNERFPEPDF